MQSATLLSLPEQLRHLSSSQRKKREEAWRFLEETAMREGSVTSITCLVIPHLLEQAARPGSLYRARVLAYLTQASQGHGWEVQRYHDHATLQRRIAAVKRLGEGALSRWLTRRPRQRPPESVVRCHQALSEGSSILCLLLRDPDPVTRRLAARLVSWCPSPETIQELSRILQEPSDDATRAVALGSLAVVAPAQARAVAEVELSRTEPSLTRLCAAYLACFNWDALHGRAGEVLLGHLSGPPLADYALLGTESDLYTDIGRAMVSLPTPLRLQATQRLVEAIASQPATAAPWLCVALDLCFPQPIHRVAQLSELQRDVLGRLARLSWSAEEQLSQRLVDELHARGLEKVGRELSGYQGP